MGHTTKTRNRTNLVADELLHLGKELGIGNGRGGMLCGGKCCEGKGEVAL